MICVSCGKKIDDDSRFCAECGAPQPDLTAPEIPLPEADLSAPVIPDAPEEKAKKEEKAAPAKAQTEAKADKPEPVKPAPQPVPQPAAGAPPYNGQMSAGYTQPAGGYAPYNGPVYEPAPPVREEAPPPPPPAPVSTKVGAGKLIAAWFISLLAIIVLTVLSLAFSVKLGITGNNVRRSIEGMTADNVLGADVNGESLSDNIYKGIGFNDITHGKADKYTFRAFMTKTDFLSFAGKKAAGYVDCIIGGSEQDPSISENDLISFFENNASVSEDFFGYKLQTADYNTIRRNLDKENFIYKASLAGLSDAVGTPLQNLCYIFSYITLGILFALLLVLLIWIAVVTDRRGKYIVGSYGKILMWSGFIVLLVALAASAGTAIVYVLTGWFEFYVAASVLLPFAAFAGIIGLFEIILGLVFRKIRKSIRARERRDSAVEKALAEH